jgi:phosphopentomutase
MNRAIVIVLDGCGAGAAPDAAEFGDFDDPATVRHVWERAGGLKTPNLISCGFMAACGVNEASLPPTGFGARWAKLQELSKGGKDSVTGHWEMAGIVTETRFPTYPDGFPSDVVEAFEQAIGREILGNRAASGTEIINQLGWQNVQTGKPIVYTSADSVFQIACHESVCSIPELYGFCEIARRLLVEPHNVERVIARPFKGDAETGFIRTDARRDFPLSPPPNLCDIVGDVFGIGPVPELFGGRGFRQIRRTQNNVEHAELLREALESDARFIWANFEDFDMRFGHRNDAPGFAKALEDFDLFLGELLGLLREDDLVLLTADHGNDPTTASTDHSREFVPGVVLGKKVADRSLGTVKGMTAIGATVAKHLSLDWAIGTAL